MPFDDPLHDREADPGALDLVVGVRPQEPGSVSGSPPRDDRHED